MENIAQQAAMVAGVVAACLSGPAPGMPGMGAADASVEFDGSVRVYSGKELAGLMKARGAQALSAQDVQRVAHQIGQRCRTVEPLLGEAKRAA